MKREKNITFLHTLNKYREIRNCEDRIIMVKARSEYKALLRCRYEHGKEQTSRFINAKFKNARLY